MKPADHHICGPGFFIYSYKLKQGVPMNHGSFYAAKAAAFTIKESKDVLAVLESMDLAAREQVKDIEKLEPVKTEDALWVLKKHRYEGWAAGLKPEMYR